MSRSSVRTKSSIHAKMLLREGTVNQTTISPKQFSTASLTTTSRLSTHLIWKWSTCKPTRLSLIARQSLNSSSWIHSIMIGFPGTNSLLTLEGKSETTVSTLLPTWKVTHSSSKSHLMILRPSSSSSIHRILLTSLFHSEFLLKS